MGALARARDALPQRLPAAFNKSSMVRRTAVLSTTSQPGHGGEGTRCHTDDATGEHHESPKLLRTVIVAVFRPAVL